MGLREDLDEVGRAAKRLDGELDSLGYGGNDAERIAAMKVLGWEAVVALKRFILSLDRSKS